MTSLPDAVMSAFRADGGLAKADPHYIERDEQVRMAVAVAETIEGRGALVVAAGTGVGNECPDFRQCHVVRARREAMAADVVVINHHLFFADMTLRDTGLAELLPSVDVALFDEAHQLTEAGVQFLGTTLGTSQLIDF